jgi:hypothetical protein
MEDGAEDEGGVEYGSREWWRWEARARRFLAWAEWVESPGYHRTRKAERPKCGARCRDGHPCQALPVWDQTRNAPRNGRCRVHGGLSTGPRRRKPPTTATPLPEGNPQGLLGQVAESRAVWTRSEAEGVALLQRVIARAESSDSWVTLRAAILVLDLSSVRRQLREYR